MSVAVSGRVIIKAIRDREGVAFQLAQLGRQHPLRRCWNQPPEFAEPAGAIFEMERIATLYLPPITSSVASIGDT